MMEEFVRSLNGLFTENGVVNFPVDVVETEDGYTVIADLCGYAKENISIQYEDDYLILETTEVIAPKDVKYVLKERSLGKKTRNIYLPDVNAEAITAKFTDGVLVVALQIKKPDIKTIQID